MNTSWVKERLVRGITFTSFVSCLIFAFWSLSKEPTESQKLDLSRRNLLLLGWASHKWLEQTALEHNRSLICLPPTPEKIIAKTLTNSKALDNPRTNKNIGYIYYAPNKVNGFSVTQGDEILVAENLIDSGHNEVAILYVAAEVEVISKAEYEKKIEQMKEKYPELLATPIVNTGKENANQQ